MAELGANNPFADDISRSRSSSSAGNSGAGSRHPSTSSSNPFAAAGSDDGGAATSTAARPAASPAPAAPIRNVPERIVFVVDIHEAMAAKPFDRISRLAAVKNALDIFIKTKHRVSASHQYALALAAGHTCTWLVDFTSDPEDFLLVSGQLDVSDIAPEAFDLHSVFDEIMAHLDMKALSASPRAFTTRAIVLFARSNVTPTYRETTASKALLAHPGFFLDFLYLHEPVSQDNATQDTFNLFLGLDPRLDRSYVGDVTSSMRSLYDHMAKLLAHPMQRSPPHAANHSLEQSEEDLL